MSSIWGTSSNDFYSSIFASSGTSSNNLLGDYSMIKSGAYKKLLNAYYATKQENPAKGGSDSGNASVNSSTEETEAAADLLKVKTEAENLYNALEDLENKNLYKSTGVDEAGNAIYDRTKIKDAVKSYVEAYNSYIKEAGDADSKGVLKRTLSMVKGNSANKALLKEIGITIGKDNTLSLDEEKLNSAKMTTLSTLFVGHSSYADMMKHQAGESYKIANSAAYKNKHASSYTFNGDYSLLGSRNTGLDRYL